MSDSVHENARRVAQDCGSALAENDQCAKSLGIAIEMGEAGHTVARMTVTQAMLNGNGSCHGGMMFTLADGAFGYACQSRNQVSVASSCSIEFLCPAALGDELTASAVERSLAGRLGLYDVELRNQRDELVALFRGKSYRTREPVVAGLMTE